MEKLVTFMVDGEEVNIYQYSAKSISLSISEKLGRTFAFDLAKLYGKFNPHLKPGFGSWIFSATRYEQLTTFLSAKSAPAPLHSPVPKHSPAIAQECPCATKPIERIEIWTDGGADLHLAASYGYVIVHFMGFEVVKTIEGNGSIEAPFTAPHAETWGCIEGIRATDEYLISIEKELPIDYYCDAEFVTKSLTVWGVKRGLDENNWLKKEYGELLYSIYVWIQDYRTRNIFNIYHVKGHSGFVYNDRADQLATEARK